MKLPFVTITAAYHSDGIDRFLKKEPGVQPAIIICLGWINLTSLPRSIQVILLRYGDILGVSRAHLVAVFGFIALLCFNAMNLFPMGIHWLIWSVLGIVLPCIGIIACVKAPRVKDQKRHFLLNGMTLACSGILVSFGLNAALKGPTTCLPDGWGVALGASLPTYIGVLSVALASNIIAHAIIVENKIPEPGSKITEYREMMEVVTPFPTQTGIAQESDGTVV